MNFFQLPIGAGRNDPVVGEVDGAQIRMAPNGTRYYEQYQEPAKRAIIEALTTTLDDQGRAIHDRTPQQPVPGKAIVDALLGGVTQGLTAPGRALRGEPVTYGDAWATALDYGVGSAPTSAPDGALRAGAMRGYHGSGTRGIKDWRVKRSKYDGRLTDPVFFAIDEPGAESALDYANGYNYNRMTGEDMAGQTYTVDIPANQNILDARIPEERAKLIEALDASPRFHEGGAAFLENQSQYGSQLPGWGDDRLYDALDKAGYEGVVLQERPAVGGYGGVISTAIFDPDAVRMASDAQPGISRGAEGGTRNFVVFDEDLISIVRKYGIAGAAAALGMTSEEVQQRMNGIEGGS